MSKDGDCGRERNKNYLGGTVDRPRVILTECKLRSRRKWIIFEKQFDQNFVVDREKKKDRETLRQIRVRQRPDKNSRHA